MPDLYRVADVAVCYGPRAFRGPALLLRFFDKSKKKKLHAYDQPRNYDTFFYKQRVTCEENELHSRYTRHVRGQAATLSRVLWRSLNDTSEGNNCIERRHTPCFVRLFISITSIDPI